MDLSDHDSERIDRTRRTSTEHHLIRFLRDNKFDVGDWVIKMWRVYDENGDDVWRAMKISESNPALKKFKIVHVDEEGVPWFKSLRVNGELADDLNSITHYRLDCERIEPDPEYVDYMLLHDDGNEYDPLATYKMMKGDR